MATTSDTTPHRGRPRDPSRDAAILDATFALLVELGYERTTVEAIAQRAGVGKPTIYRRWPDGKAQLVADALRHVKASRPVPDTGSLRGDLLAMVGAAAEQMADNSALAAGLACRIREDADLAAAIRDGIVTDERARWGVVVDRAIARGELSAPPTDLFCDLAPSLMHGRLTMTNEPTDEAFVLDLVDNVLLPVLHHTPTHPNG